ncbi:MAG: hypothetical protein WCR30_03325 [Clostridia bacterium]
MGFFKLKKFSSKLIKQAVKTLQPEKEYLKTDLGCKSETILKNIELLKYINKKIKETDYSLDVLRDVEAGNIDISKSLSDSVALDLIETSKLIENSKILKEVILYDVLEYEKKAKEASNILDNVFIELNVKSRNDDIKLNVMKSYVNTHNERLHAIKKEIKETRIL